MSEPHVESLEIPKMKPFGEARKSFDKTFKEVSLKEFVEPKGAKKPN